jgi:stalled ribosome alternative rescue factor ArfA
LEESENKDIENNPRSKGAGKYSRMKDRDNDSNYNSNSKKNIDKKPAIDDFDNE